MCTPTIKCTITPYAEILLCDRIILNRPVFLHWKDMRAVQVENSCLDIKNAAALTYLFKPESGPRAHLDKLFT